MMPQVIGSIVSAQSAPAAAVKTPPPPPATVIESVSFRGRTISSLRRPADGNQYVLLEAVCRVFFPHQHNVAGFIRAAETLLHIPDVQMTADEQQQFLSFYKLPTDRLRHNRLISVDTLADIFPRLEVLFSADLPAEGHLIGTVITRPPSDSTTDTAARQTPTTTTNNNNNNSDEDQKNQADVARPRKRRRNNVADVVVID